MSNAVPLKLAASIVQSVNLTTDSQTNIIKNKLNSTSPLPNLNKQLACNLTKNTSSSLSSSSSNSEVNSVTQEEQLNLSMTSNTSTNPDNTRIASNINTNTTTTIIPTNNNTSNTNKVLNNSKTNYYHPNQGTHQNIVQNDMNSQHPSIINPHQIPLNLNHFNGQYIQLNSNSNSTPINSSPISSSPSNPIQYISHHQTHKYHHSHPGHQGVLHAAPPYQTHHITQHQQFQQLQQPNYKDTRWLTLEVCREFQRNKCNRNETECKFAHPLPHVEIINGKVIACYDSLKGKCTRKEPPCKYLHPPHHLKDQLLQNGKNNLVLRQVALAMMQQQQTQNVQTNPDPQTTASLIAATTRQNTQNIQYANFTTATSPTNTNSSNSSNVNVNPPTQFLSAPSLTNGGIPAYQQVQLANGQSHLLQMIPPSNGYHHQNPHQMTHNLQQMQSNIYANDPNSLLQQVSHNSTISPPVVTNTNSILPPQQRTDRLQDHSRTLNKSSNLNLNICKDFQKKTCSKNASECAHSHPPPHCPVDQENLLVTVCVDFIKGKCSRETCKYFHPPEHLVAQLKKQKLTNNALAAAQFATNNISIYNNNHSAFSAIQSLNNLNANPISHHLHQKSSFSSPYRLNRTEYESSSNLQQILQLPDQGLHQQLFNQQRTLNQQYAAASPFQLTSRINAYNNNNAFLRASSSSSPYVDSNSPQITENNHKTQISSATAALLTTAPNSVGSNSHQELNDPNNGTIITLENGQSYQLPQYQMYTPVFQRAQNNSTNEDANSLADSNNNANIASANSIATANDNLPGKKRTHDSIEQDFNSMTSGNIYSASNLQLKRTALTDTKTGMPIFHPLGQNGPLHHITGQQQAGAPGNIYSQQTQQMQPIALTQQNLAALNYPGAYNLSQMPYAPYPATFSLPYNGQPTSIPRL